MPDFHDVHMYRMLKKVHIVSLSNVPRDPRVHALVLVLQTTWRTASKKLTLQGPYAIWASMLDMCHMALADMLASSDNRRLA